MKRYKKIFSVLVCLIMILSPFSGIQFVSQEQEPIDDNPMQEEDTNFINQTNDTQSFPNISEDKKIENRNKRLPEYLLEHKEYKIDPKSIVNNFIREKQETFNFEIGEIKIEVPYFVEKYNMSKFLEVDKNGESKVANLEQIYKIEAMDANTLSLIVTESTIRGTILVEDDRFEIKPRYQNGTYTPSKYHVLYNESMVFDPNPYYEEASKDKTTLDFQYNSSQSISLDATYSIDVVRSSSASFYNDHGSNWGSEIVSIWDGGGGADPNTALESELNIDFSIQSTFTFTSGGPDDTDGCTFKDEFTSFMSGLEPDDVSYDPDWGWMVSGHDFDENIIGCATPGSLNNPSGISVNEAKNGANRKVRNSMMHEGGHVMIDVNYNHHADGETNSKFCYITSYWWNQRTVMDTPYRNDPICAFPALIRRDFFFSSTNQNHANQYIAHVM